MRRSVGHLLRILSPGIVTVLLVACATTYQFGQFTEFRTYTKEQGFLRLPVIFIPGIKGSRLVLVDGTKEIKELWGTSSQVAFLSDFDDLLIPFDSRMGPPGTAGESYPRPEDYRPWDGRLQKRLTVEAQFLPHYRLGFSESWVFSKVDVYGKLREFLENPSQGDYRADGDLFFFSYDWRLDIRLAAIRLALELPIYRAKYMQYMADRYCETHNLGRCTPGNDRFQKHWEDIKKDRRNAGFFNRNGDVKFLVVGHSMGGLVARYLIWGMEQQDDVARLILMATPNFGAIDALKGFDHGEYPESLLTFLGKKTGLSPYSETDTKPVLFSFASAFQLLPRHPRGLDASLLETLGLDVQRTLAQLQGRSPKNYYDAYHGLELLPSVSSVRRYLRHLDQNAAEAVMADHLYANLRASLCFHLTISFEAVEKPDLRREISRQCQEEERIFVGEAFVKSVAPQILSRLPERIEPVAAPPPVIVFGGHCHPTYYRAELKGRRLSYRIAPKVVDGSGEQFEYGDARVPTWSSFWDRPLDGVAPGYNFFLCEDHLGLVKSAAFRYNLLRELIVIRRLSIPVRQGER